MARITHSNYHEEIQDVNSGANFPTTLYPRGKILLNLDAKQLVDTTQSKIPRHTGILNFP